MQFGRAHSIAIYLCLATAQVGTLPALNADSLVQSRKGNGEERAVDLAAVLESRGQAAPADSPTLPKLQQSQTLEFTALLPPASIDESTKETLRSNIRQRDERTARSYRYEGELVALREIPGVFSAGHVDNAPVPSPTPVMLAETTVIAHFSEATADIWKIEIEVLGQDSLSDLEKVDRLNRLADLGLENKLRGILALEWVYPALQNETSGTLLFPTPRLIVELRSGFDEGALAHLPGVRPLRKLRLTESQYLVEIDDYLEHPCDAASRLEAADAVSWVEPDFAQQFSRDHVPNDPLFTNQWHLRNTGQGGGVPGADARLVNAWNTEPGNGSVVIAVIDDGVQLSHPDFAGRIFVNAGDPPGGGDNDGNGYANDTNGWDFYFNDNNPNPILTGPGSHGTSVAGVAAGAGENGLGVAGACLNCRILPVRIFNGGAIATTSAVAEAIRYAGTFAWVLNNSWGGGSPSSSITSAVNFVALSGAGGLGTPVVFSSGNSASGYRSFLISGIPAGTYTFQWVFQKDSSVSAGQDRVWLDNVIFPDGSVETFESCSGLPGGWISNAGAAPWSLSSIETRASSSRGGRCSLRSGVIGNSQFSEVHATRSFGASGALAYQMWASTERNSADGSGPLVLDNGVPPAECYDAGFLNIYDAGLNLIFQGFALCGTWSNQGNPLADGVVAYPANLSNSIAVGAASNFDRRSDYSQWGPELDYVTHSAGGSLGITTTDIVGTNGYSTSDYASSFGGTSSAAPLASGIIGLLLSDQPWLTLSQVRQKLNLGTRKIGTVPYSSGWNNQYGYGALSGEALLGGAPGPCVASSSTLCLNQSRFRVRVNWRTPQGQTGTGQAIPYTTDSGFFWFFNNTNLEMMIKVLNACVAPWNKFWVFHAATTNVEYTLTVTDTVTGAVKTYYNPMNHAATTVLDTSAFATCSATAGEPESAETLAASAAFDAFSASELSESVDSQAAQKVMRELADLEAAFAARTGAPVDPNSTGARSELLGLQEEIAEHGEANPAPEGGPLACTNLPQALCLNSSRFRATVNWRTPQGQSGAGQAIPYTSDSGFFWFFQNTNLEMMIKVLNACVAPWNRYWVFHAATTNVEYTLTVTDTQTGQVRTYFNPLNHAATTILDTQAFATCP